MVERQQYRCGFCGSDVYCTHGEYRKHVDEHNIEIGMEERNTNEVPKN